MRAIFQSRLLLVFPMILCQAASAQWLNYVPKGTPLTKDGKPNLSAPTPRAPDGHPDLSGVWMHESFTTAEMKKIYGNSLDSELGNGLLGMDLSTVHKYAMNMLLDYKQNEILTPAALDAMKRHAAERDVTDVCHNRYGWPVLDLLSEPMKIVQSSKETLILYEIDNLHRQVFVDGREFPKEFDLPAFLGYSIGHWEGDTFVIDTKGFNDKTPIDAMGHPRSEDMHVTERITRRDFGHLDYDLTFDDPKMYKQKISVHIPHELVPDYDIFEMFCNENEKDRGHMTTSDKRR